MKYKNDFKISNESNFFKLDQHPFKQVIFLRKLEYDAEFDY